MLRSALAKFIRLPLRLIPKLTPLRILSGPLAGKRWLSTSGTHGCWLGTYEADLQRLLVDTLRPGDVFYDIGANVGFFTLFASQRVGSSGRVIACGTARFATGNSPSQGSLAETGIEVSLVALDELVLAAPTVKKIDVEGAESRVLVGATRALTEHRPLIFLSTHGFQQHEACTRFLEGMGYCLTLRRNGAIDGQYESIARAM